MQKALGNMQEAGLWSFQALQQADRGSLAEVIRPSGYYNTKARKLQEFASVVIEDFDGSVEALLALDIPELRQRLLEIWGIGEETADDIVLYAAGKPSFVIDTYTRRIVDRIGWKTGGAKYVDLSAALCRPVAGRRPAYSTNFTRFWTLTDPRTCKKIAALPRLSIAGSVPDRLRSPAPPEVERFPGVDSRFHGNDEVTLGITDCYTRMAPAITRHPRRRFPFSETFA